MHRQGLLLGDCAIIPNIENEPFQTFVTDGVRPAVLEHYERALTLTGQVNAANTASPAVEPTPGGVALCENACIEQNTGLNAGLRAAACR